MKPEYLNSLKAGIKTAFITFITTILAALPGLMDAFRSWTVDGNPPDMSIYQSLGLSAVFALLIGLGNVVLRFLQAASVPVFSQILDKVIGVIPDYLPPPAAPVDAIGPDNAGVNKPYDRGDIGVVELLLIAIAVGVAFCLFKLY